MNLIQINLQPHFGGGEVYTAFLCRALSQLGMPTRLLVHPRATYWGHMGLPKDTELITVANPEYLPTYLPSDSVWLLSHGPLPASLRKAKPGRLRTAIAHMPVQGRNPAAFADHDKVFAVSGWVLEGLQAAGLPAWTEPLYGVADLSLRNHGNSPLRRTSRYDWDRRKFRDRLLSWLEPAVEPWRSHPHYEKRPGLTLGIVSRLTPIKQFPLLFGSLAPMLARMPDVNLEIFGSGGYASVRDVSHALRPIASRVRFWGQQSDVVTAYRGIDYLLTGLPEKEALGLNVIEAQAVGTPVLAPAAPPFTETIVEGVTGFFYRDPRQDHGADFARLLAQLQTLPKPPDPRMATEHLAKFSPDAFRERLRPIVAWVNGVLAMC